MKRDFVAFALEGAISAEMLLFAAFLLTNRRRTAALYLLAALSCALAAMVAANLLMGAVGLPWLVDFVLFLDLLAPALFYLYVRQVRHPAKPLSILDLAHALPAMIGLTAWKIGALSSMDLYVIGCWTIYLAAAALYFGLAYADYAPAKLRQFIILVLVVLVAITILRVVMAAEAMTGIPFRSGLAYVAVLVAVFLVTCQLLFTSLHYPNLLTTPASHIKYARSSLDAAALGGLEQRFRQLFEEQKPYLNSDLTLAELSVMLDASERQLSQFVNARFGMNIPAYMNQCRVRHAAASLTATRDKPIKIVMFEAGFTSKNIFNLEFQRNMGVSPTIYRRTRLGLSDAASKEP